LSKSIAIEPGLLELLQKVAGVRFFWDTVYIIPQVPLWLWKMRCGHVLSTLYWFNYFFIPNFFNSTLHAPTNMCKKSKY